MRAFHHPDQMRHDPRFFLMRGAVRRNYEVPARAAFAARGPRRTRHRGGSGAAAGGGRARGGAQRAITSNSWRARRATGRRCRRAGRRRSRTSIPTPEMLAQGARPGDGVIGRVGWFTADAACPIGPGTWEACLAAAGTALGGGSGGGAGRHRLCAVPPARPPRLRGAGGRALLRQQRRARRAKASARGGGAGRGDRHRQPPRQRDAGHLLGGRRRC